MSDICKYDTDNDGNCPRHLGGCAEAIREERRKKPGTKEAIADGCLCPEEEIFGWYEMEDGSDRRWMSSECPMHGDKVSGPKPENNPTER